jgi:endonuclease/exonuclease/phosphatase family metal-dependent hydrolase
VDVGRLAGGQQPAGQSVPSVRIKVLSYNIHKGFSLGLKSGRTLSLIRDAIHEVQPDIALLQEVLGRHDRHSARFADWPTGPQVEFLAEGLWPHYSYGKNAVYTLGHHGNAILSKFPITASDNIDISKNRLESRGMLHAVLNVPGIRPPIHVICTHLGLFEVDRKAQIADVAERIRKLVPPGEPVIVGGDFNDWRERTSDTLADVADLEEGFLKTTGQHARTYPSWLPVLRLDRIYYRGLGIRSASVLEGPPWNRLSDHLAVHAELEWSTTS